MKKVTRKGLLPEDYHQKIYMFLLVAIAVSIPLSRAVLSIAIIICALNWILSLNFKEKFNLLNSDKTVYIFASIYLISIVFLLNTDDFKGGIEDLKLKLPFLAFPLIIASSKKINPIFFFKIILLLGISSGLKSAYTVYVYSTKDISHLYYASLDISYIRLSLINLITAFYIVYFVFLTDKISKYKFIYAAIFILLCFFIILLKSLTVNILLFIFSVIFFIAFIRKFGNKKFIVYISVGGFLSVLIIICYLSYTIFIYNRLNESNLPDYSLKTSTGNSYYHEPENTDRENGYYVYRYICEPEMSAAWNLKSSFDFYSKDKRGQEIKYTLMRYLSSKGLRKDKEGVNSLIKNDINNVENGLSNYIFANKLSFYPKLYVFYWEIEQYFKGNNAQGMSVVQRIFFARNGFNIIKQNFWFGVGTGDLELEYKKEYENSKTELDEKYRLKPHNQFITYFVCFGLFGFLYIIFALLYPVLKKNRYKSLIVIVMFLPLIFSMFTEDTLEEQKGITLFVLFYSLTIFGFEEKKTK